MSSFISRIVVAVAALPLVLGLVWLGGWWLFALVAVGALIALHEFYAMARPLRPLVAAGYGGGLLALVGAQAGGLDWALAGFLATFVLAFVLNGIAETRAPATVAISSTVFGAAWVGLTLAHAILLRDIPDRGRLLAFTVLLAVFADDTFAYFVGRLVGRHKLAPRLSPGKTWEGFVAGSAAAIFVAFIALYDDRDTFLTIWQAIVLGVVIALAEASGDLFESALKRDMQVKDTGRLLAGHGGVLDRIDSLLFALPAAYYLVRAFGYA
ncbi:MAG TPA: phosphatidate cytidylyltransferase [Gaiellaceae bacterium]|jgi:phosphatidate cytidylyltransferase